MKKDAANHDLAEIKERLRENKLTHEDVKKLEEIIVNVEKAAAQLRAAVVE